MQHQVVVPAGDRDRVELNRPEPPEDLHHPIQASRDRPRRRQEVPRHQKPPRRLSTDLHPKTLTRRRGGVSSEREMGGAGGKQDNRASGEKNCDTCLLCARSSSIIPWSPTSSPRCATSPATPRRPAA